MADYPSRASGGVKFEDDDDSSVLSDVVEYDEETTMDQVSDNLILLMLCLLCGSDAINNLLDFHVSQLRRSK